jgi:ferritin-like metal-binding protein YciE
MPLTTLEDLLVHELRDLLNAEKQLLKALPRMAKAATNEALADALATHLAETEEQVERLNECFAHLGLAARGKKCAGMEGLIKEGTEVLAECEDDEVADAAIIASAQRIEHYEISAYGTARAFALRLGHEEIAELLNETLEEESAADETLSSIAEIEVNSAAQSEESAPPGPPSDLIPVKGANGNGQSKMPDPKVHDGILKPKKTVYARPVSDRKWRRGLGAH